MENLPQVQNPQIVNIEDYAMSVEGITKQVQLIQKVMGAVMQKDEHYGIIPGTQKPSLLKPGAEKLCLTFRLDPDYKIIREVREKDFIAYTIKCDLTHIPTSQNIASGIGSCNSRETKYRYRHIEESTGKPVPREYWSAKTANNSKEMKRILGGDGFRASKIDNNWVIAKSQKIENDNPWDLDNTIIKMACKRALVAATLNATAASDIFTQDIEDMPPEIISPEKKAPPKAATKVEPEAVGNKEIPKVENPEPIEQKTLNKLVMTLGKKGVFNPADQLATVGPMFNKKFSALADLTDQEGQEAIKKLQESELDDVPL